MVHRSSISVLLLNNRMVKICRTIMKRTKLQKISATICPTNVYTHTYTHTQTDMDRQTNNCLNFHFLFGEVLEEKKKIKEKKVFSYKCDCDLSLYFPYLKLSKRKSEYSSSYHHHHYHYLFCLIIIIIMITKGCINKGEKNNCAKGNLYACSNDDK